MIRLRAMRIGVSRVLKTAKVVRGGKHRGRGPGSVLLRAPLVPAPAPLPRVLGVSVRVLRVLCLRERSATDGGGGGAGDDGRTRSRR